MATVFQVRHQVLGSRHALKVLRPDLVDDDVLRARFLEEGRLQAQLVHPALVRVTDIVSEQGVAGLVMDLVEGETLADRLERGKLPVVEAASWMLQVLAGVGHAHAHQVVHRDLKPANLTLVDRGGRVWVKVLDFGIAKVSGGRHTRSDSTIGTVAYMSPEQVQDPAAVDLRSDIFALGGVLYEMVTGQLPFEQATDYETMQRVVAGSYTPPQQLDPELPTPLCEIITRALQVEPGARFSSCAAFAAALSPLADADTRALVSRWMAGDSDPQRPQHTSGATLPTSASAQPRATPVRLTAPGSAPVLLAPPDEPEPATLLGPQRVPQLPAVRHDPVAAWDEQPLMSPGVAVRLAATLQLISGALDAMVLWLLSCYGLGAFSVFLADTLGLPGWISWIGWCGGVMGVVLVALGMIEILGAAFALLRGRSAARVVRGVAWLEVASIGFGGVLSFVVGVVSLWLLWVWGPHSEA